MTPQTGGFADPQQLQAIQEWLGWQSTPVPVFAPRFEVKDTKEAFVFKADLPGVEGKNLEVSLTGSVLSVSGLRIEDDSQKGETFFAHERAYGNFSRTFTLPEGINRDQVSCALKDGVLTLLVPKTPEQQPKKI